MNFDLTEDQREIKRTARDWLAARYPIARVREIALDGGADDTWDEMVELGWPEIADFGMVELAVVAEELGYVAGADAAGLALGRAAAASGAGGARDGRDVGPGRVRSRAPPRWTALKGTKIAVPAADGADVFVVTTAAGPLRGARLGGVRRARPRAGPDPPAVHRRSSTAAARRSPATTSARAWHAIAVAAAAESVGVAAARDADVRRVRQGAQAVRAPDRLLPGRLPRLRADVPGDRGRAQRRPVGRLGARARPRERLHGRELRQGLRERRRRERLPLSACRSTAGSASPGSTTCTCTSSAPKPTPARSATPRWHREQVAAAYL